MSKVKLIRQDFEERHYGTSFDPVLNGVADGLSRLFPPVQHARPSEIDDRVAVDDEAESDEVED